jgi:hypothetical protein
MILPTTTRRMTKLRGDFLKKPSPIFLPLKNHPKTMNIIRRSTILSGNCLLIFIISDMMGTIEIKNRSPVSKLNKVTNMTGKESK